MERQALPLPKITPASQLAEGPGRWFIGAYGFEQRSLGWVSHQHGRDSILEGALVFHYRNPKGKNRVNHLRQCLQDLGAGVIRDIPCDARNPYGIEEAISRAIAQVDTADELIIDISAMTKLLILVCLTMVRQFRGTVRIVYSEAVEYAPTQEEYKLARQSMEAMASFPSRGIESVVRLDSLSSIRMQGQPATLVAFTSFNEQLVRNMLGTITPHRLLFINGRPPRADFRWREGATQEIHSHLIDEYSADNEVDESGALLRVVSTLDYTETVECLDSVYRQYGRYERIICAATGSKMQTLGLFIAKVMHPDIHIEYPTPDSYFVKGMSTGVRAIHEVVFHRNRDFLESLESRRYRPHPLPEDIIASMAELRM